MATQVGVAVRAGVVHVHALVYAARDQAAAQRAPETKRNRL